MAASPTPRPRLACWCRVAIAVAMLVPLLVPLRVEAQVSPGGLFFDDFSHADVQAMGASGWILRRTPGHPGVPGALWAAEGVSLVPDADNAGNRLLRLRARTDGTPAGTRQVQVCHARKLLHGTYAARLRFSDAPVQGLQGDPIIQAFYAVAPLQHDYDPRFSEVDWEYLPNGGWGSNQARLYGISWQTVRLEPWDALNSAQEVSGHMGGWHVLTMQVQPDAVLMYLDDRLVARHGGRNVPVQPMALNFSAWFSPTGLMAPTDAPRVWELKADWAFHAQGNTLTPDQVLAEVRRLRESGLTQVDTVRAPTPDLSSPCDM